MGSTKSCFGPFPHRVLRGFNAPGSSAPRPEVLRYLFQLCLRSTDDGYGNTRYNEDLSGDGVTAPTADPSYLFELMFGSPIKEKRQQQLPRQQRFLTTQMQQGKKTLEINVVSHHMIAHMTEG
jgi:hypothetical protein